jgi:hypothetical protein
MRRAWAIAALLVLILGGVAIGIGAYNAGVHHGLAQANGASQVVRVVGPGAYGFFPFGFFLFPLFFILVFVLFRAAFWGRRWGGPGGPDHGHWGPGFGPEGRRAALDEWHRQKHEQGTPSAPGSGSGAGGEPAHI